MNILSEAAFARRIPGMATLFLALAAIATLGAGFYIGLYNDLAFDDIPRKMAGNHDVFAGALRFYLHETGRFTNGVLTQYSGLYELEVYRKLPIVLGCLWFLSLWLFLSGVLESFGAKHSRQTALAISALLIVVMVANAPNLAEWWFWYTTASLYMFGTTMLLFTGAAMFHAANRNSVTWWWIAGVLMFITIGTNELVMAVAAGAGFVFVAGLFLSRRRFAPVIPVLFTLAGVAAVVLSPGTTRRLQMVSGQGTFEQFLDQLLALPIGIMQTLFSGLAYWTQDLFWVAVIVVSLMFGVFSGRNSKLRISRGTFVLLALIWAATFLALSAVVVMMDWKININDPSRTANLAYFLFLLLMAIAGFALGGFLAGCFELSDRVTNGVAILLPLACLATVAIAWRTENIEVMVEDIRLNKPVRQAQSIALWDELIADAKRNGEREIVVPNMIPANTLVVYRRGPAIDPEYRMNKYWTRYKDILGWSFSRRNFDRDLLEFIETKFEPLTKRFEVKPYRDEYRNYLVVQVPRETRGGDKFCMDLKPDDGSIIYEKVRDENFGSLYFNWRHNHHCTRFGMRRIFCEPADGEKFCRIPLPLSFSGAVDVSWGQATQMVSIRSGA